MKTLSWRTSGAAGSRCCCEAEFGVKTELFLAFFTAVSSSMICVFQLHDTLVVQMCVCVCDAVVRIWPGVCVHGCRLWWRHRLNVLRSADDSRPGQTAGSCTFLSSSVLSNFCSAVSSLFFPFALLSLHLALRSTLLSQRGWVGRFSHLHLSPPSGGGRAAGGEWSRLNLKCRKRFLMCGTDIKGNYPPIFHRCTSMSWWDHCRWRAAAWNQPIEWECEDLI